MVFAFVPWATGIACASVAVTMATREISEAQEQMLYDSRRAAAGVTPYRPYHPVEKPSIFSPQVSNMVLLRVYNQFFGHGTKDYMMDRSSRAVARQSSISSIESRRPTESPQPFFLLSHSRPGHSITPRSVDSHLEGPLDSGAAGDMELPLVRQKKNSRATSYHRAFNIVDFYSSYDDVPDQPRVFLTSSRATAGSRRGFLRRLHTKFWTLLALLAVLDAAISYGMDVAQEWLKGVRMSIACDAATAEEEPCKDFDKLSHPLSYISYSVGLVILANLVCQLLSTEAIGSGIPQVKTILGGASLPGTLEPKTFVAKCVGLTLVLGGGLWAGKEGPYVHIASCLAYMLTSLPFFRSCRQSRTRWMQVLSAAVCCGVVSTFGCPFGALLFSIEVTASFFVVHHLWTSMVCVLCCTITIKLFQASNTIDLFQPIDNLPNWDISWELINFALLGVVAGLTGGLFAWILARMLDATKRFKTTRFRQILFCAVATALVALCDFYIPWLRNCDKVTINELFSTQGPLSWDRYLFFIIIIKMLGIAVVICLPLPAGVFAPTFLAGALLGRFYYLVTFTIGDSTKLFSFEKPANAYAIVGAAALSGGFTRTISTAVIVFELTNNLSLLVPVITAVLVAYTVNGALMPSFYDVMLIFRELPYTPALLRDDQYALSAKDMMDHMGPGKVASLRGTTMRELDEVARYYLQPPKDQMRHHRPIDPYVPVVQYQGGRPVLRGTAKALDLALVASESYEMGEDPDYTLVDWTALADLIDWAPLVVGPNTPAARLHFIFTMLGLEQVAVIDVDGLSEPPPTLTSSMSLNGGFMPAHVNGASLLGIIDKDTFN
ncbi:Chloride Channel [Perkinsus chesapeaki]|uniref:Chloride Channel n=1 Tax=Perkinsus chesapeaki TaxID=330153 RepID=A0A7J6LLU9_PERCH|nr:Chloride Channel [Perkinsus chesapeaki]